MAVRFPPGFCFGASSAAYQIEGGVSADGRGESIWDRFCRVPGAVADASSGAIACEHYYRWREDVELMMELGLQTYRFSIAWPRVQPTGSGALNPKGLDFYRRLLSALGEAGIDPVVTLYHADLPAPLQDRGGWAQRDTVERFAVYAGAMAERLGDLVGHWITHNEPWGVAFSGHADGSKAPGLRDWPTALQVAHHLLVSHGLGVQAVRAARPAAAVGISLNLACAHPSAGTPADVAAAERQDAFVNRWFLDPLLRGGYPDELRARLADFEVADGDLATIATPIDFLGINVYSPDWVRAAETEPLALEHAVPPGPHTPLGLQIDPRNLREILTRLTTEYEAPPIWITENGIPDDSSAPLRQRLEDDARVRFLADHLQAVSTAIADGADVRRYFVWSLLDSFEWELGHQAPFGLIHVEPTTQRRTPKRSAWWYRDLIHAVERDLASD